jgi:putative ABC transport system permease protein
VNGATITQVVALLGREFAVLVVVAFVFAAVPAYVVMQRWLERFAYRVDAGADVVLVAGAIAFAIAVLTVGRQALRAARANPAQSLRYE